MLRLAAIVGSLTLSFAAHTASLDVVDGDKVLLDGRLAQLVDIDSPELCQRGGAQARQILIVLLDGEVTYEPVGKTADGVDLIRLYVDKREVNQLLVQHGWAWDTTQSSPSRYAFAEAVAKEDRIGLWAAKNPVPPWEWKPTVGRDDASSCIEYSLYRVTLPRDQLSDMQGQPSTDPLHLRG